MQERRDKTAQRQQAVVKLANELEAQRQNLLEQALALTGELRLLDELIKEESNGTGSGTEEADTGASQVQEANHP